MKFVFLDKNAVETDIITDILSTENIRYKVAEKPVTIISMPLMTTEILMYDIEINTTLEYFDFVNRIANRKIKELVKLEKCYAKQVKKRKIKKGEVENEKIV